jgi:hypothetical protein
MYRIKKSKQSTPQQRILTYIDLEVGLGIKYGYS